MKSFLLILLVLCGTTLANASEIGYGREICNVPTKQMAQDFLMNAAKVVGSESSELEFVSSRLISDDNYAYVYVGSIGKNTYQVTVQTDDLCFPKKIEVSGVSVLK